MRKLLLLLTLSVSAQATQAWVQNGPTTCHNTSGNIACAITGTTSGNILLIGAAYRTNSATDITSVTGSLGTPAQISAANAGASSTAAWLYCEPLTSSGTETITVTLNGTYFFGNIVIQEFSGSTCTTDGTGSSSSSNTNPACGTFTPATADTIVAATVYANESSNTLSAGTGYATNALILNNGGSTRSAGLEFKVVSASASQSPVWVDPTSGSYSCASAAVKTSAVSAVRHRVTQ